MKYVIGKISLCILMIFTSQIVYSANNKYDVFIDGCHLDMPVPEADKWYGLFREKDAKTAHVRLVRARLKLSKKIAHVDDLFDYCVQSRPAANEKSSDKALALLKGNFFRAGDVKTVVSDRTWFNELKDKPRPGGHLPPTDETMTIRLGSRVYQLRQQTRLDDYAEGNNHILTLRHNGKAQVLFDQRGNYEGGTDFYIIWAGDLDGDEKLDMVVNLPVHYASPYHLRVFVSSLAEKGKLVKQVAERGFLSP